MRLPRFLTRRNEIPYTPVPSPAAVAEPEAEARQGTCGRALSTGRPCPDHPTTTWPEGVVLRYLTLGGATVDVRELDGDPSIRSTFTVVCTGCGEHWGRSNKTYATGRGHEHSEKCRALPLPRSCP